MNIPHTGDSYVLPEDYVIDYMNEIHFGHLCDDLVEVCRQSAVEENAGVNAGRLVEVPEGFIVSLNNVNGGYNNDLIPKLHEVCEKVPGTARVWIWQGREGALNIQFRAAPPPTGLLSRLKNNVRFHVAVISFSWILTIAIAYNIGRRELLRRIARRGVAMHLKRF